MSEKKIEQRIVFMGSGSFALSILADLVENSSDVVALYTQQAKPVKAKKGAGEEETEIEKFAEEMKIPVFHPASFTDQEIDELKKLNPEMIIVAAYGKILPEAVLDIPKYGAINVHPSLIPKLRGPSPIQNAILSGEKMTGSTIMLMNKGIDTGMILSQQQVPIEVDETYPQLLARLSKVSSRLLLDTLPNWIEKKIQPIEQNDEQATLCQLIERSDGHIVWADGAESIYNKYRAFIPWPGIFTFWEKEGFNLRLKLNKVSLIKTNPEIKRKVGEVFEIGDKIGVQTANGVIVLEEVQLEGKSANKISDFLNGNKDFLGSILK